MQKKGEEKGRKKPFLIMKYCCQFDESGVLQPKEKKSDTVSLQIIERCCKSNSLFSMPRVDKTSSNRWKLQNHSSETLENLFWNNACCKQGRSCGRLWERCRPREVLRSDAAAAGSVFLWGDGPGDLARSFPFPRFDYSICKYQGILKEGFKLVFEFINVLCLIAGNQGI